MCYSVQRCRQYVCFVDYKRLAGSLLDVMLLRMESFFSDDGIVEHENSRGGTYRRFDAMKTRGSLLTIRTGEDGKEKGMGVRNMLKYMLT